MTDEITIRAPDDWHVHVRDGAMLRAVLPFTARTFARAIVMPNLVPPVVTTADAVAYRERILAALPEGSSFTPLMTAYLRDDTDAGRHRARFSRWRPHRRKALPGARHHQRRGRRHRHCARCGRFSRGWRRSACRSSSTARTLAPDVDIFDREASLRRAAARAAPPRFPRPQGGAGASFDRGGGRLRPGPRAAARRHHHAAPPRREHATAGSATASARTSTACR